MFHEWGEDSTFERFVQDLHITISSSRSTHPLLNSPFFKCFWICFWIFYELHIVHKLLSEKTTPKKTQPGWKEMEQMLLAFHHKGAFICILFVAAINKSQRPSPQASLPAISQMVSVLFPSTSLAFCYRGHKCGFNHPSITTRVSRAHWSRDIASLFIFWPQRVLHAMQMRLIASGAFCRGGLWFGLHPHKIKSAAAKP